LKGVAAIFLALFCALPPLLVYELETHLPIGYKVTRYPQTCCSVVKVPHWNDIGSKRPSSTFLHQSLCFPPKYSPVAQNVSKWAVSISAALNTAGRACGDPFAFACFLASLLGEIVTPQH